MKTAISIPDAVFQQGEDLAKDLGWSRSELYSKALRTFIESYIDEQTTTELDRVYSEESSAPDPVLSRLQLASLDDAEW